jgi:hypothetical protein
MNLLTGVRMLLAWFGGDPHLQSLSHQGISCNVRGSFIYATTTAEANITANASTTSSLNPAVLLNNDLFSIVARTSNAQSRLRAANFFNQNLTYFSSFSMYLGSERDVMIDVDINSSATYQFSKSDLSIHPAYR